MAHSKPLRLTPSAQIYRVTGASKEKLALLCQLMTTVLVLGWVPGNLLKLLLMFVIWGLGFRRITSREIWVIAAVNLFFAVMNTAALRRGIFGFNHPDFMGMPVWEYFMWGFYTLHTVRLLGGTPPRPRRIATLSAAMLFALPFATIADPMVLLLASSAALALCFVQFHDKMDWAYAGYMALLGALIESVGVCTQQWRYPDQPYGGVPLWFLTMWVGVGLFTRRIVQPLARPG
jgi:hypothetical protein